MEDRSGKPPEDREAARAENRWEVKPLRQVEFGYTPTPPTGPPPDAAERPKRVRRHRPSKRRAG